MQALYIPSFANNRPLRYYDNKNRITITYSEQHIAKQLFDAKRSHLDRTITRIMLKSPAKAIYNGYDTYKCNVWVYPGTDLSHVELVSEKDILNYGESFVVVESDGAFLHIQNSPIIDVDFALEIP